MKTRKRLRLKTKNATMKSADGLDVFDDEDWKVFDEEDGDRPVRDYCDDYE